jgi:hypothetical protein
MAYTHPLIGSAFRQRCQPDRQAIVTSRAGDITARCNQADTADLPKAADLLRDTLPNNHRADTADHRKVTAALLRVTADRLKATALRATADRNTVSLRSNRTLRLLGLAGLRVASSR